MTIITILAVAVLGVIYLAALVAAVMWEYARAEMEREDEKEDEHHGD